MIELTNVDKLKMGRLLSDLYEAIEWLSDEQDWKLRMKYENIAKQLIFKITSLINE